MDFGCHISDTTVRSYHLISDYLNSERILALNWREVKDSAVS